MRARAGTAETPGELQIVTEKPCELCDSRDEIILWRDALCRVALIDDPDYPGFCRVILERHVTEMTDLSSGERTRFMDAVFATEEALRQLLRPDKVNLASLGNATPHLHWHVIPRFRDDHHFPRPIWAEPSRNDFPKRPPPERAALALLLKQRLA